MNSQADSATQAIGDDVSNFSLPDLSGTRTSLADTLRDKTGAVVVFWSGICSHCQRYDTYLNGFSERHRELALAVVASRQDESVEDLRRVVDNRGISFPVLHDRERRVAHAWLVEQTPRVFLVDARRRLLYRGAIDNFKYPRDPEHESYLEPAITDLLASRPVRRQETPSFGCPIESVYYKIPSPFGA